MSQQKNDAYQARTLNSSMTSQQRRLLLPAYPSHKYDTRLPLLLLANVHTIDRDLMEIFAYSGDNDPGHLDFCPFQLNIDSKHEFLPSYMIDIFYQKLYMETSRKWKLPLSLIDYNLVRLHHCMNIYSKQVGESAIAFIDELPLALEFYLQIDVDLFFMKTCDYGDVQQQKEGLLCEFEPIARYGMKRCRQDHCFLCQSKIIKSNFTSLFNIIQYTDEQIHEFLNGYQAILNCPAKCDTSNIIYALTCPCVQYDYIGSTSKSFHDRLTEHREEGHRMMREFLFGSTIMNMMSKQDKRNLYRSLINPYDELLYQHSTQCSYGLQRFLDQNSNYWCFVPQPSGTVQFDNEQYRNLKKNIIREETTTTKPMLFASIVHDLKRTQEETYQLIRHLPEPPSGYEFSLQQRDEQYRFFCERKETSILPSDYVDYYKYTIIAVLPMNCSRHLRNFIESLFITHAETKLNTIGHLTQQHYPYQEIDRSYRGQWCHELIYPTTTTTTMDG